MTSRLPLLIVPALLLGCGQGGDRGLSTPPPVPVVTLEKGKEATIMPLQKGNTWTYTWEQSGMLANGQTNTTQREIIWTVVNSKPVPGGVRATIEVKMAGGKPDLQTWRLDNTGLYQEQVSKSKPPYRPSLPVMRFPLDANASFKWKGQGMLPIMTVGPMAVDIHMQGSQEVDTDMHRMAAIAVQSSSRFSNKGRDGMALNTAWFRPGVGLVRLRSEVMIVGTVIGVTVFKLKSTNLKTS